MTANWQVFCRSLTGSACCRSWHVRVDSGSLWVCHYVLEEYGSFSGWVSIYNEDYNEPVGGEVAHDIGNDGADEWVGTVFLQLSDIFHHEKWKHIFCGDIGCGRAT